MTPEEKMAKLRAVLVDLRDQWSQREQDRRHNLRQSDMAFGAVTAFDNAIEALDTVGKL